MIRRFAVCVDLTRVGQSTQWEGRILSPPAVPMHAVWVNLRSYRNARPRQGLSCDLALIPPFLIGSVHLCYLSVATLRGAFCAGD